MVVMVLVCLVNCISFSIISLHQECCPYMLLQNNWWNQVSPFWHDTDNGIKISIHIILRSRHNPRTDHGTMLIDDLPQNFHMAHGINMNDVIYHYEWKCQSAWQLHQLFEVCDIIVISYDIILCYGIGMQSQLCDLRDVTKCSTVPYKNTPPSAILTADINNHPTSGEPRIFSQLHPPLVINEHKHPFGIKNPKFQCYLNSVLQLIFLIFRKTSYTSPFNSSTDGVLLKCFLKTAHTAWSSKDVDAL